MSDQNQVPPVSPNSLEYISKVGREFYLESLREQLEKNHLGEFVVIEPHSQKYFVDEDLLIALKKAEKNFPDNLFYIVKIGTLLPPANNFMQQQPSYAWHI